MGEPEPAIGIDLGTTFSCVAVFQNDKVEILANESSNRTTPSYVAFNKTEMLVGEAAKDQAAMNPQNTVFDAKRLIGRKFSDPMVQEDIKNWPFKILEREGSIQIELEVKGEKQYFKPEQISGLILGKMKKIAENFIGREVKKAVITVPAYFNDYQRNATKVAGELAGLNVLRIINEPTAAGIAYGFNNKFTENKNILVFDLGGGTYDVSILTVGNGFYEVKSTAGDTHLGGEDFDNNMVEMFLQEIMRKHKKDLTKDIKAKYRLKVQWERAKKVLSTQESTKISIDSLFDGNDFNLEVSRARFNQINEHLFRKIEVPLEKALEDANMEKEAIDCVVLIGGSSKIRYVQDTIKKFFANKDLNKNINPDEAVAHGAAVLAAYLNGEKHKSLENFNLKDVIPLSLGMEVVGGRMEVFIPRNTPLPATASHTITTHFDDQKAISIVVYEGERPLVKENNRLGEFIIKGILPANREVPKIEVIFTVNKDGILEVSATDTRGDLKPQNKKIESKHGRISEPEIRQMIQDAIKFQEDDEKEKARIAAKLALEDYCLEGKSRVRSAKHLSVEEINDIIQACDEILNWIENNEEEEEKTYEKKRRELNLKFDPILARITER